MSEQRPQAQGNKSVQNTPQPKVQGVRFDGEFAEWDYLSPDDQAAIRAAENARSTSGATENSNGGEQ